MLHHDPTSSNHFNEVMQSISIYLPIDKWGDFLTRWAQALEAYGTPIDFINGFNVSALTMKVGDKEFPATQVASDGYLRRREYMSRQAKYVPRMDPSEIGLNLDLSNCFLCENVCQAALDNTNVVYDLETHYILPNRYPAYPGHSLLVPKNHDSKRSTVGKVLTKEELLITMEAADRYSLVACRNHVHDAMSIPSHDHFHLIPRDLPIFPFLEQLRSQYGSHIRSLRAKFSSESAFDHLVLVSPTRGELAIQAAPILDAFENSGQVYSLLYSERILIIGHRFDDALSKKKLSTGAGVLLPVFIKNGDDFSPSTSDIESQVPVNNKSCPKVELQSLASELPKRKEYHPLNYGKLLKFGSGANIRQVLTINELKLWDLLLAKQDKRSDPGHAEIVTLFSTLIGRCAGLNERELMTARIAAMLHDTGYSLIDGIDTRFKSIQSRRLSEDPQTRHEADNEDKAIRIEHQVRAVELSNQILPYFFDDELVREVNQIIGDHDTRVNPPSSRACAVMWDADMLWRVTLTGLLAAREQLSVDSTGVLKLQAKWAGQENYITEAARLIAHEEWVNSEILYASSLK